MSTFKVNIINLNDQEAGFKFIKKMGSDFKKSRALSNKRKKVIKKMKKQLKEDMKEYQKSELYAKLKKKDKKLREPILKELKDAMKTGVMGVGAGFLSKAFSKIPKSELEELADGSDSELMDAYNSAISNAISKKYPSASSFQEFAEESVNNSIRKVYNGFKLEAAKNKQKYSEIPENTEATLEDVEAVFEQMQREKICFEIGLQHGVDTCSDDNIKEQKDQIKKFKRELKKLNDAIKKKFEPLNELDADHDDLVDKLNNLGLKSLNKNETDINQEIETKKLEILSKVYQEIFNVQPLGVPEGLNKQKMYEALKNKYFDPEKHKETAFTPDSVNKSPIKAVRNRLKALTKIKLPFREGELDQEGGHYADDFESSIPDDDDVYGVTLSEVINSSNSSRRSSRRSSRKKSSKKRR